MSRPRIRLAAVGVIMLSVLAAFQNCGGMRSAPGGYASLQSERNIGGIPNPGPASPDPTAAATPAPVPAPAPAPAPMPAPAAPAQTVLTLPTAILPLRDPVAVIETNPGGLPNAYAYGPSITHDRGEFHMLYCSSGDPNGSWDYIRYRKSQDGVTWTDENIVMAASDGSRSRDRSACDPSVVKFQGPADAKAYYYLFYTGNMHEAYCDDPSSAGYHAPNPQNCGQGAIFVARSTNLAGPYEKFMGNGVWLPMDAVVRDSNDADVTKFAALSPKPVVLRRGLDQGITGPNSYGAGGQTVVIRNGLLHMWYIDDSFAQVNHGHVYHLTSIDGLTWSSAAETNITFGQNSDVKFDPVANVYAMFSLATFSPFGGWAEGSHVRGSNVIRRDSTDGITFGEPKLVAANRPTLDYINNLGVGSDNQGALDPTFQMVAYGAPMHIPGLTCQNEGCWAQWNIDAMMWNGQAAQMWRLYGPASGDHVMTSNSFERDSLTTAGWTLENLSRLKVNRFCERDTDRPVTRLYNPGGGQLYYTANRSERDSLVKAGWQNQRVEGFVRSVDDGAGVEIGHAYNPDEGFHVFSTNAQEITTLIGLGYTRSSSLGWSPQ